ncbi:unnamed protein product [Vitrella brassicaformis CCMP3155]|uniref:Uncharacterized protein n=1 Tax=Vitrella brassicaformis (strain CCMP3155) TaxID=1169540 RepID=A0A0G4F2P8_VITBC|nr:unnamed protein product [Vitrella brassicaformis CCMP3155]|eukprot:CEM05662.1 unnamed protein product [Vitrella brassicaformis CCMP3155]
MSGGDDAAHMASAAMADDGDGGGDADDVVEKDNNGGGEADGQDDNNADSDLLCEEEDGEMTEEEDGEMAEEEDSEMTEEEDGEMAEEEGGLQAAADSESESRLTSRHQRLIARHPTLATQRRFNGINLVHRAAERAQGHFPPSFVDSYLDLVTANGADIMAESLGGRTPLYDAAYYGSPYVADYLCRKLPADQIDRRDCFGIGETPLAIAAWWLDHHTQLQELQHPDMSEATGEEYRAESDKYKRIIHSLLRAGADISSMRTASEEGRRQRQLVLAEYATVLNELPTAVMAAVNAALAPHRSLAALLTPRLAAGPQEAPIFGWRIASYLFDMDAAKEAITEEAIGVRHSDMARRVCAAAEHFVKSAVYQPSSNREVVGGTTDVGGQVRAILDEAAKWELVGQIDNGFSKDVPAVVWGAVGWVKRERDGRETFRSLQLT